MNLMRPQNTVVSHSMTLSLNLYLNNIVCLKQVVMVLQILLHNHSGSKFWIATIWEKNVLRKLDCSRLRLMSVVKFYVNDTNILQNVETDLHSMGDIAVVRQELERQKIRLGNLMSNFQQFINVQKLFGDGIQTSYVITDDIRSQYDSDSDNVDNDSDDDMVTVV